jgi:hypothetical protein
MVHRKTCGVRVNARQSIAIFGLWDQPRHVVEWQDVTSRNLTWRTLRDVMGFEAEQLQKMQPDPVEWVHRASITLADLPDMTSFPVNPFEHLHADLAEVWSMRWSADELKQLDVTFDQLQRKGMNPQVMMHFGFTLGQWMSLGMQTRHAEAMDEDCIARCFDMTKGDILDVVGNYV